MPIPLSRRHALLAAGGLFLAARPVLAATPASAPGFGIPASGRLAFDAFRNGSPIGTHVVAFASQGGALTVRSTVGFEVRLGPIPLFRYRLDTTKHWQDGRLRAAAATADDNGKPGSMTARALAGGVSTVAADDAPDGDRILDVDGSKSGRYSTPPGSLVSTHWNRAELAAPAVNPQDGTLMRFAVADRGIETITAAGAAIKATHYALTGPATLDLWYDERGVWSALRAVADDGSVIEYRLT